MLKNKKRAIILLLVLCLLVSLGAGCSKKTAETAKNADDDYVVKLGYYNCDHMTAACIAKDTGIFDKLGVKVEVTGNGEVPKAMAAGQMDVGYVGVEGLELAYAKGAPVFIAANNHLGGSWYLVASNNIKEAKDLVGKKVALGTNAHETSPSWVLMARALGIPADTKQYESFDMKDSDEYLAMKTGKLDGYTCCDPWGSMAEYEGTGHILAAGSPKLQSGNLGVCCIYSMRKGFAAEHPELAKKMLLAHTQALEFIYIHPAKAAKIFAANYKVPEEVAFMTIYKKTMAEGRTLTWILDKNGLEETFTEAKANGIKNFLDYKSDPAFANTTLLEQAGVDDFNKFIKEQVDPVFPQGMTYADWKTKALQIDA
ncbi:MAG: ABC transporter substrate-binding subunit SaoX [Syntrophomonadaceae bacterium]